MRNKTRNISLHVNKRQLRDIVSISTGNRPSKDIESGQYAYINGGTSPSDYLSVYNSEPNAITTPTHGEGGIGFVAFQEKKFWCGALCLKMYALSSDVNIKYIFYYLSNNKEEILSKKNYGGMPYINKTEFSKIQISLPHIKVQEEIVEILDSFTNLIDSLNKELSLRQKQFEYYREKLLTFEDTIQQKEIGELCSKVENIKWSSDVELKYIDLSSIPCKENRINDCQLISRENAPSRARQIIKTNDILFGTTRPTQMRLCVVPEEYNNQICSTGYCVLRLNNMNHKYIYYCLSSSRFMDYCDLWQDGGSYPSISDSKVKAYEVPIPSSSIQQSIVEKLDAFESLISSLKEEIALRQKQYEYYREKLLTFN